MTRLRRRATLGGAAAVALTAAALGAGCGTDGVVVVTLPAPEAGHAACSVPSFDGGSAQTLGDAAPPPCNQGEFCQPMACGVATGTCEVVPPLCDAPYSPVCGCDGVSYFNDCARQSAQVGATVASGPCGLTAASCNEQNKCAESDAGQAVCAVVVTVSPMLAPVLGAGLEMLCNVPDGIGFCWVLPTTPPSSNEGTLLRRADPTNPLCFGACQSPYAALHPGGGIFIEGTDCAPTGSDGGSNGGDAGVGGAEGGGPQPGG
jgi:hypothetical protein